MSAEVYVRIAKHAALRQKEPLVAALRDLVSDPRDIADTLRTHHLVRLVHAALPEPELRAALPAAVAEQVEAWRSLPWTSTEDLLRDFGPVRAALDSEGVPWLLLKGFYFGERLYGGLERRPQHDVDVLVLERDFRRALRVLGRLFFVRQSYDLHSETLARGGFRLDVHRCLRRAPAFRESEPAMWDSALSVRIAGSEFRTLSDEWTLVFLALAAFEDLGQGMAKLKQLLDLYFFLRATDASLDWEGFFTRREGENLQGVCVNVFAVVMELFETREELRGLGAALDARRSLMKRTGRADAFDLVFAERKRPESLAWFAAIYPGSLASYLVWFWYGGFPANLGHFGARRLLASLGLAVGLGPAAKAAKR